MDTQANILRLVIEWIWIPIIMILMRLYGKITGLETRSALMEQAQAHYESMMVKLEEFHEQQRQDILSKVGDHHDAVMKRMDRLEEAVKNGHAK